MTPKKFKVVGVSSYTPKDETRKPSKILHCISVEGDNDGNRFVATVFVNFDSKTKVNDIVHLLYFGGRYNIINI